MKKSVFIFICLLTACMLTGCFEFVNTDTASPPAASSAIPAASAAPPSATALPSSTAASEIPSASSTNAPAEATPAEDPSNTAELYSSYAHMVSFDPDSGLAEFDYFDILRGEDAISWLVEQEGYNLADAQEEVTNYADSEFIEKNTNPQLRTIDLKETALQLIVGPDGALNEGAESSEVEIGEYCALYQADPSLLLDLYFYYIEAEGGKAVSVGQVYWP